MTGACVTPCGPACKAEKAPAYKKWASEFLASFWLVLIILTSAETSNLLTNALGQGLGLYVIASIFYTSSQVNGIFTLLAFFLRLRPKINGLTLLINLALQAIGAWLAALAYSALNPSSTTLGATGLGTGVSIGRGFLAEYLASTIVLTAAVVVTGNYRLPRDGPSPLYNNGNLVVGISLSLAVYLAGSISGAGVNPWRSMGPFFVIGFPSEWWIYWVAPLVAAITVWVLFRFLLKDRLVRNVRQ